MTSIGSRSANSAPRSHSLLSTKLSMSRSTTRLMWGSIAAIAPGENRGISSRR